MSRDFFKTAAVAFFAAAAGAGVVAMMGQGQTQPQKKGDIQAVAAMVANDTERLRTETKDNPPRVYAVPADGWALVIAPTGYGYIVKEDGSFRRIEIESALLETVGIKADPNSPKKRRAFSFTTEQASMRLDDFGDEATSTTPTPATSKP